MPGTFDDALIQVGALGRYQILLFIMVTASFIPQGWHTTAMIFLGANRDHWCHVKGLENFTEAQRRQMVEPVFCGVSVHTDRCRQCFQNVSGLVDQVTTNNNNNNNNNVINTSRIAGYMSENSTFGTNDVIKPCDSWEFSSDMFTSTLVDKFNLVCDREWMIAMIQTIYMTGFMIGVFVFGAISDRFGRMTAFLIALTLEVLITVVEIYVPYYWLFTLCRFLLGAAVGAVIVSAYVMALELTIPRHRTAVGIFIQIGFDTGVVLSAAVGYGARHHVTMQWIMAVPAIIFFAMKLLFPESPRWLLSQGRYEEVDKILRKIAKFNRRAKPKGLANKLRSDTNLETPKASWLDLVRTPNLRKRTIASCFVWFTCSAILYGLVFTPGVFGLNIFANCAQSGAAVVISGFPTLLLVKKLGRRFGAMTAFFVTGLALFVCIPLVDYPHLMPLLFTISFIGKIANGCTFNTSYLHSSEFYPTVVRNIGVSTCSTAARVAGLLAPQIERMEIIWRPLPAIVLGSLAILAGLVVLLLPETLDQKLPETLEDGERFGTKQSMGDEGDPAASNPLAQSHNHRI